MRVRLGSLTHQSYMACIRPSYCCAWQKFGSSISAGSFIALIFQSNAVGSRKNEPVWCSRHVFYSWSQASFTHSQSSSTSLFCYSNICEFRGLFYVCMDVIFSNPKINSMHSLTCMKDAKCLFCLTYNETDQWMRLWKSLKMLWFHFNDIRIKTYDASKGN